MGGNAQAGGWVAGDTEPIEATQPQELISLHAAVEPDGSAVNLEIQTTRGRIDLAVELAHMPAAAAEIREAENLMMRRRLGACRKRSQSIIQDLMRRAARPATIMPTIDHLTGDCVIVYRFEDRMPLIVRLTMEQLAEVRANFSVELARLAH
jgi:hypothetical protein